MQFMKSDKLRDVCYDIRGPVLTTARRLEEEGYRVAKLNIGDPAPWGFAAPDEIIPRRHHQPPARPGVQRGAGPVLGAQGSDAALPGARRAAG